MLICVTHSLPSLRPLLRGVSHSRGEKQMSTVFDLFFRKTSLMNRVVFLLVWCFFIVYFQSAE